MKCYVGLGNPGDQYSNTKHNFGYWVVDSFLKENDLQLKLGKGDFVFAKSDDFILAKSTSFMNNSGKSIASLVNYFNIDFQDLVIIYDDIDLPLGSIRFKKQGGSGGHKGIESVIYHLMDENFVRLKLGIATDMRMRPSEEYVLKPFPEKYFIGVQGTINKACEGLKFLLNNSITETMNQFNRTIEGDQNNE